MKEASFVKKKSFEAVSAIFLTTTFFQCYKPKTHFEKPLYHYFKFQKIFLAFWSARRSDSGSHISERMLHIQENPK